MPEFLPEYMGYDRTIAVFSPDGRLFQVEYAKEAVKKGITAIGITFKDGVVLGSVKIANELQVPESLEKIFMIDDHLGAVSAGLIADARFLINFARLRAQSHKLTYDEEIDVWGIARVLGDRMQLSTLYGGLRPFGVSFLIGGVDKTGTHLIEADPSGSLFEWKATAIGRGSQMAMKILKQKWNENLTKGDAIKLAVEILSKVEKKGKIEIVVITKGEKFTRLSEDELSKYK